MKTVITWVHHNRQFLMMDVTIEGNSTFVRFFKALLLIFKKYVCQLFLIHRIQFRRCDTQIFPVWQTMHLKIYLRGLIVFSFCRFVCKCISLSI